MASAANIAPIKVRQRSCIACGSKEDKRSFYRFVRTADAEVLFDPSGKLPGRGAYICSLTCFEKAMKAGRLSKSLKCSIEAPVYEYLHSQFSEYLSENVSG